jgi:hypothetical protein
MTDLQKIMNVVSHSPGGDTPHLQISQPAQHEELQQCHWKCVCFSHYLARFRINRKSPAIMSAEQGDQSKSFQDNFVPKETPDSFQRQEKCHPTVMKPSISYQSSYWYTNSRKISKKQILLKNVSKKFGPFIQVTEHKAPLLSVDRRAPHESHTAKQYVPHYTQ